MTRPQKSMDGFIPRRSGTPLKRYQELSGAAARRPSVHGLERNGTRPARQAELQPRTGALEQSQAGGLKRADIDESLRELDTDPPKVRKKRIRWRLRRPSNVKKILKSVIILLVIIGVIVGGWLGYKTLGSVNSMFGGGLLGLVQRQPLKQDENGRSNVLIFGTSEDSADHNTNGGEGGPLLTDSMMVLSVNQEKKDAFMVSIPRDLWVKFDEPCSVGYQHKINSVYQCGSNFGEDPEAGAKALQKKVGEVLGLDIQYYGQVDYSVVTKAVDAVGGVEVTIESNPPGVGILDRNFDWKCNYQCYYVKYKDGEKVTLDGEHALALSRARNANGGYGIGDNFGREKNQQKIMKALREKALSLGTLTNLGKVTELLEAMGENLKTNVEKSEVQTIMSLATEISSDAIVSLDLYDEDNPLVQTGPVGGTSAVLPVAGMFRYNQIHAFIAKASSSDAATKEGAKIAVLNGSGVAGAAQNEADWLEGKGFSIGQIGNAPEGEYKATKIYQRGDGMPATKSKLEGLYSVTVGAAPPVPVNGEIDFLVILGENNPARQVAEL